MAAAREPRNLADQVPVLTAFYRLLKDYFFAIFGAAVLALFLRVYVVEAFRIPADFMAPTLIAGDHIFVNKLAYGKLGTTVPARGDVVIFSFPNDPTKDYIKRVVAVAGDTVEIKEAQLFINGKKVSRLMESDLYEETLDGRSYFVQWKGATAESRHLMPITVPKESVFVLGDNRVNKLDSRSWGFLSLSSLKGRASVILLSVGSGEGGVRWSRFFKKVN